MELKIIEHLGEGMVLVINENRVKYVMSLEQWSQYLFTNPQ